MRKPVLYIMVGCSGSGKSTIAEAIRTYLKDIYIVSPDNFRKLLYNDVNYQKKNKEVFARAYASMNLLLKTGHNVIFDAANVTTFARINLISKVQAECEIKIIYVKVDFETALNRVKYRTNGQKVPEKVVFNQYNRLKKSEKELFDCPYDVIAIKNNKENKEKIIDNILFM